MYVMRKLLKSRSGFTLVELMVVVVVLGILAGIAVQRMGDVRDRAETAAREANVRLLLGAANLAKTRNYGDYMYVYDSPGSDASLYGEHNNTLRWQRPCDGPPVTQFLGVVHYLQNNYITGYGNFAGGRHTYWDPGNPMYNWRSGQEWCLTDYLESFPVGYAVEIVFAARDPETKEIIKTTGGTSGHEGNLIPFVRGYHPDRTNVEDNGDPPNPYDADQIFIYRFIGDETSEPKTWHPIDTDGSSMGDGRIDGYDYPYHNEFAASPSDHWELVFPETP